MGGGLGESAVIHSWRGSRSGLKALALAAVCDFPSIPMILPAAGNLCWRRSRTYPTKDTSVGALLLCLALPTKLGGPKLYSPTSKSPPLRAGPQHFLPARSRGGRH